MVFKLGKLIGKGSDGTVYELITEDGKTRAIKFIQGEMFGIKNYVEYYIINNLDEKYILKCKEIEVKDDGLIKLIFDKANMDLKDFIKNRRLNLKKKINIMKKLLIGLEYLQSHNIIHGDIKPSNILVFDDLQIKYTDFNLATIYLEDREVDKKFYTVTFRPPEIINKKITLKSDIWALACTFFEIYYGYEYFNYCKDKKYYHIKNSSENKEENLVFNDLIDNMLKTETEERYSIKDIKNHKFFQEEKFTEKFSQKKVLNQKSFNNILKTNFKKFDIKTEIDEKIFISKIYNFLCIGIHKNYKKIEKEICKNKFDIQLFD